MIRYNKTDFAFPIIGYMMPTEKVIFLTEGL